VEVVDDEKAFAKSNVIEIYAGNEQPEMKIAIQGNQSFYFPGKPIEYKVTVADKGDSIHQNNLFVSSDYIRFDRAQQAMTGHQMVSAAIIGQNMIASSDCKTCHKVDGKSIGPSFKLVAERYGKKPEAPAYLVQKIIKGGAGVWGEVAMPAHPTLKETDAAQIVQFVLSLGSQQANKKSLPAAGKLMTAVPDVETRRTAFAIQATYTDNGGPGIKPLSSTAAAYLRYNIIYANELTDINGFNTKDSAGVRYLTYPQNDGWIKLTKLDLTGIKNIVLVSYGLNVLQSIHLEVRTGKPDGDVIGSVGLSNVKGDASIPINNASSELQDIYIVFKTTTSGNPRPLLKEIKFTPGEDRGADIAKRP
jgi:cytochrome c551/c552